MSNYTLTIKRKRNSGGRIYNPPIIIITKNNEYTVENGKEIEISLPAGKNKIEFKCTFKMDIYDSGMTSTEDIEFNLRENSKMEISYFGGVIRIDKSPVPIIQQKTTNRCNVSTNDELTTVNHPTKSNVVDLPIKIDEHWAEGFSLLKNKKWKQAKTFFEDTAGTESQSPFPYLGKLLATLKLTALEELVNSQRTFEGSKNYKQAYLFADNDLKEKLENLVLQYKNRCEKEYLHALSLMEQANTSEDFNVCNELFRALGNYKDSEEKREYCIEKYIALIGKKNQHTNKKIPLFFCNLWNNNVAMIVIAAVFLFFTLIAFSGDVLIPIIVSEVIGIAFSVGIFKNVFESEENKNSLGKVVLIATIASFVFGLVLGLISGIELYPSYSDCPYCGGKGYFGGGEYGQMVDCPDC